MTEAMRRELIVAMSVAGHSGQNYQTMTPEGRRRCHAVARSAMTGVNQLIADATINTQRELGENIAEHTRKAQSKAYYDGFEDGLRNDYQNRWEMKDPWPSLTG